jgi:hypothetical protein
MGGKERERWLEMANLNEKSTVLIWFICGGYQGIKSWFNGGTFQVTKTGGIGTRGALLQAHTTMLF